MSQPGYRSGQGRIDATNSRIDQLTEWFDRIVPLRRLRPLDRIPSIKLKLSILIVAGIGITVVTSTVGFWLNVKPVWNLIAAVVAALVLVQILARGITTPLREMARAADQMAVGDLDQRVTATASDELGQLGRSFNQMAAHIVELERQRRDLIANVSHELRTPIAVIQGNVENLLDSVVEDEAETLAAMLRQTQRLGRLVSQLMDLSRLEAGALPLHSEHIELVAVVDGVLEEARLAEPEPKITFSAKNDVPMWGDPGRLHQVVGNVIENAVRYSPASETITIDLVVHADTVSLTVNDRGPGIPTGDLERVFERFHRSDADRSGATGGSGLGLAISRWIVELHGGSIAAANTAPTGCTITITLPAKGPTPTR